MPITEKEKREILDKVGDNATSIINILCAVLDKNERIEALEKALRELVEKAEALFGTIKTSSATIAAYSAYGEAVHKAKELLGEK